LNTTMDGGAAWGAAGPELDEDTFDEEAPLTEEELATQQELDTKMMDAMALNQQLKTMVSQLEQQEQLALPLQQPGRIRPPPRPKPRAAGSGAKNGGWGGETHTRLRANEIDHANAILVAKLSNIATQRGRESLIGAPVHRLPGRSSAQINMSKKDREIAAQNAKMAKRLATVRPTQALSGKEIASHAANHQRYSRNVSRAPGAVAPPPRSNVRPGPLTSVLGPPPPQPMPRRIASASRAPNGRMASAGSRKGMAQVRITGGPGWQ